MVSCVDAEASSFSSDAAASFSSSREEDFFFSGAGTATTTVWTFGAHEWLRRLANVHLCAAST